MWLTTLGYLVKVRHFYESDGSRSNKGRRKCKFLHRRKENEEVRGTVDAQPPPPFASGTRQSTIYRAGDLWEQHEGRDGCAVWHFTEGKVSKVHAYKVTRVPLVV